LSDGQTVTGSFVFDADAPSIPFNGVASDISIVNSGATYLPSRTWDRPFVQNAASDPITAAFSYQMWVLSGPAESTNEALGIDWEGLLTDAGGTLSLSTSSLIYWRCLDSHYELAPDCSDATALSGGDGSPPYGVRFISGTITTVPIPAAFWFLGSGLGLLAWIRRKTA
jgi:hypothetical protein